MSFQFSHRETIPEGLQRVFLERLDQSLDLLNDPARGQLPKAIHGARKEFKRMRAILRLARPALGRKRFNRENKALRDVGRVLSPVRDSQVLHDAFAHLLDSSSQPVSFETTASVRRGLKRHLEAVRKTTALDEQVSGVLEELGALRERTTHWAPSGSKGDGHENDWDTWLGDGLCASYQRGRAALQHIESDKDALNAPWHNLRKRVKDIAFQLRLFRPLWKRGIKMLVREFDAVADALGDDHDLLVLRALLLDPKEPWAAPGDLEPVIVLIDARRGHLQRKGLKTARRLLLEKPADFEARLYGYWEVWQGDKR